MTTGVNGAMFWVVNFRFKNIDRKFSEISVFKSRILDKVEQDLSLTLLILKADGFLVEIEW